MNESYFNGLGVVLVKDSACLQKQVDCPSRIWDRIRGNVVFSGPSLLAQITGPSHGDISTKGIELAREGIVQFRTHETDGCRGCPVRKFDIHNTNANPERARICTCGSIVTFTEEAIQEVEVERDGGIYVCVTVRLAGKTGRISVKGREQIALLGKAKCLNLVHFNVEPPPPYKSLLTSGNGSLTMPIYEQTIEGE